MEKFLHAVAAEFESRGLATALQVAGHLRRVAGGEVTFAPGSGARISPLEQAVTAPGADPLLELLAPMAPDLAWNTGENFPMPAGFKGRFAYCEIAGPDGMIAAEGFRFGTYIQHAETWYPLHSHAAEELYFILSGTAEWTRDGVKAQPEPPGTLIRHASHEGHATWTRTEPMLAIWAWVGDISISDYRVDDD